MVQNEKGHNVGRSHLKHRGRGDHEYQRDEDAQRGVNEDVPRGVRHGPRGEDKK